MQLGDACDYCGCILSYRATCFGALPSALSKAASGGLPESGSGANNSSESWHISYTCPGCATIGTHFTELAREAAEALAEGQRRIVESDAALESARTWKQEVRRRAEREAGVFASLVRDRFPEFQSQFRMAPVAEEAGGTAPEDLEWQCAMFAEIPSANPAVEAPLTVRVLCREVRIQWIGLWHHHFFPARGAGPSARDHLHSSADVLQSLVAEDLLAVTCYRGGEAVSACSAPRDRIPKPPWETMNPSHPACGDSMVIRSWRGTYDLVIERP